MPDSIRIAVPTRDVAASLAAGLRDCRVHVADDDGSWFLEIVCDREFNELLVKVLAGTESYLAHAPEATLRLEVEGRSYALHPPALDGARPAA